MMKMTRASVMLAVFAAASALGSQAASAHSGHPTPDNFGGNSPNIVNDFGEHYVNLNNPDVRWDWTCHQFSVPGNAGDHANQDHAAILDRGTATDLVAPGDKSNDC